MLRAFDISGSVIKVTEPVNSENKHKPLTGINGFDFTPN